MKKATMTKRSMLMTLALAMTLALSTIAAWAGPLNVYPRALLSSVPCPDGTLVPDGAPCPAVPVPCLSLAPRPGGADCILTEPGDGSHTCLGGRRDVFTCTPYTFVCDEGFWSKSHGRSYLDLRESGRCDHGGE